jgi:putative nucleotidyltransferase with HDIG domain
MTTASIQETLVQIIATIGELPPAPAVITTTINLTADLQSNISDISRILSSDQSLTAKVLKLSNSPYYGRIKEVKTLNEAVLVLGFETLRSIIMSTSVHDLYAHDKHKDLHMKLWRHSLSTAIAARQLADHLKLRDKEELFVAALMHDIGKLVLIQKLPEWYIKIIKEVESHSVSFRQVETRVFNFDHTDVAGQLLMNWTFPQSLVDAIRYHHRPPSFRKGGQIPIAQIIHLANHLAKNLNVSFNDHKYKDLNQIESAQAIGIDNDILVQILEEVKSHYRSEISIFEGL